MINGESARVDSPLVSIIAVCYNHARFVEETLESILNQTYKYIELIVIDSNSPDNSVEVIQNWMDRKNVDCRFIRQTAPRNICQNANEGLRQISGKYFQILACDDILLPDKISMQVTAMEDDAQLGLVFGNAEKIDEHSNSLGKLYINEVLIDNLSNRKFIREEIKKSNFIPAPSALIRMDCAKEIGGYDETIGIEDWDYWIRIANSSWGIQFENRIFSLYRVLNNSLWRPTSSNSLIATLNLFGKHDMFSVSNSIMDYFDYFSGLPEVEKKYIMRCLKEDKQHKILMIYRLHNLFSFSRGVNHIFKYKILNRLYNFMLVR